MFIVSIYYFHINSSGLFGDESNNIYVLMGNLCRSQWPRGLRRRSAAAGLLRSWVRIPPGAWIFVCCECCVLSGRDLCDKLITRPEESYRPWCVVVCDLENLKNEEAMTRVGSQHHSKKKKKGVICTYRHHVLFSIKIYKYIKCIASVWTEFSSTSFTSKQR